MDLWNLGLRTGEIVLVAVVACFVSAGQAAWNDDLPEVFEASTGYVTHTADDWFTSPAPCDTDFVLARSWSDKQVPHAGARYYSNHKFYTPFAVTNDSIAFAGDSLVVARLLHLLTGTLNNTTEKSISFSDLVFLGGAELSSYGPKHALAGRLRIRRSSSGTPVRLRFQANSVTAFRYPIHSALDGDPNQVIELSNNGSAILTYSFDGDLSAYKGLFRATRTGQLALKNPVGGLSARVHIGEQSKLTAADYGNLSLPELTAEKGADLTVTYGKTFTVGNLVLADGANLNFTYDTTSRASGRFVVTNAVSLAGAVNINIPSFVETDEAFEVELVRFAPEVDCSQIALEKFAFLQADQLIHTWIELRDNADGGRSLILKSYQMVRHTANKLANNSTISDLNTNTTNDVDYFWSHQSAPLMDSAETRAQTVYYSTCQIPMPVQSAPQNEVLDLGVKSLYLGRDGSLWSFYRMVGLRADLVMANGYIQMANSGVKNANFKALDGKTDLNTFRLQGTLKIVSGTTGKIIPYGNTMFVRTESELQGAGTLVLSTYKNAGDYKSNSGYHELAGANVNWAGMIKVTSDYERTKYAASGIVTPNDDYCVRLFISDGRNLGGARSEFAYDALLLEHHAILVARNSLTLEDGVNRGIAIGDRGRILVPADATVAIERPLTLNGNFVKLGPGALVLGGRLGFQNGANLVDMPVAGSNLVTVTEGSLAVSATNALDGARIILGEQAKLHVSPDVSEEVRAYGIFNTKAGGSFVSEAADGKIAVETSLPTDSTSGDLYNFTVAVCTVPQASGLTASSFRGIPPARNYEVSFSAVDRNDGTQTIYMMVKRGGLTVIFR